MTALPVFDFARDVGIDYVRDSALSNARAKARPDDARDRAAPDEVREDRISEFDKALRDQDDELSPSRAERAPERASDRVNERPKDVAAANSGRKEEPVTADATPLAESKPVPKADAAKDKPASEQSEPQTAAKPNVILPEVVQVVSAAAPNLSSSNPVPSGETSTDAQSGSADAQPGAETPVASPVIAPNAAQNLQAALAAGAPAQQQQQSAPTPADAAPVAPAADPLLALNAPQAGLKTDAPAQNAAPANNGPAPTAAVTPPGSVLEAAAATNAAPDVKVRQASDQAAKSADAPASNSTPAPAATAQHAAQPVAALQGALKAAAAQGPKDAKAADVQIAEVKAGAPAQPSAFAAQLDAQSTQTTTHASAAAPGQASPNATAIAHNVVRFFRETGTGNARFDIRLDPVELGRVDARVEINHDKTVTLTLSAERPETLAELMRSARDLERQLADSGVKLSDDGLKFRLNSDARGDAQQNMQGDGKRPARGAYGAGADSALQAEAAIPIRSWRASGVDVWA
jgi:flagellar hook-length control protein FliK